AGDRGRPRRRQDQGRHRARACEAGRGSTDGICGRLDGQRGHKKLHYSVRHTNLLLTNRGWTLIGAIPGSLRRAAGEFTHLIDFALIMSVSIQKMLSPDVRVTVLT